MPICVATVLTVYGIETFMNVYISSKMSLIQLQQYLPFTVLKLCQIHHNDGTMEVATVLTVYGIETPNHTSRRSP